MSRHRAAMRRHIAVVGLLGIMLVAGVALAIHPSPASVPDNAPSVANRDATPPQTNTPQIEASPERQVAGSSDSSLPTAEPAVPPRSSDGTGQSLTESPTPAPSQPTASAPTATLRATLLINSTVVGAVSLQVGANQCDVLRQALSDRLISSLEMRYNLQYKTEGVYVIDGIGDSNVVWWGYKVNGTSPPYGCSHVPVKNNDSVNWEYVGR